MGRRRQIDVGYDRPDSTVLDRAADVGKLVTGLAHATAPIVRAKDIADKLGLSQPTVSRVLSGATDYKVAPNTRALVLSTAHSMGYRPNALARSLRSRRTGLIGVYIDPPDADTRTALFGRVFRGLEQACLKHGVDMLIHRTTPETSPEELFERIGDGRTDGAIVYLTRTSPLVDLLRSSTFPIVALANTYAGVPSVGFQTNSKPTTEIPWLEMTVAAMDILIQRIGGADMPMLTMVAAGHTS
jgi:hypothetical protein